MVRRACWLTLLVLAWLPGRGESCNIPVFRYALERWAPSPFELVVFHRGPLARQDQERLEMLEQHANVLCTRVDLAGKVEPDLQRLWQQQGSGKLLPFLVVRFPIPWTRNRCGAGHLLRWT